MQVGAVIASFEPPFFLLDPVLVELHAASKVSLDPALHARTFALDGRLFS